MLSQTDERRERRVQLHIMAHSSALWVTSHDGTIRSRIEHLIPTDY